MLVEIFCTEYHQRFVVINELYSDCETRMEKVIANFHRELAKISTGRANPGMVDSIKVDYYGSVMPISQVASITVPEPRSIVISPFEKNMLSPIEKAIMEANIGLTPMNDGRIIRVPVPALTEDRRKEFVKQAKAIAEQEKVAVRKVRQEGNEKLKSGEKDKEISQDDLKVGQEKIQHLTDDYIKKIDHLCQTKEKAIMEV